MAAVKKPPVGAAPSPASTPTAPTPAAPTVELGPRKLIRSSLAQIRREHGQSPAPSTRKAVPADQTNAEAFYYLKQMQSRTAIVVRLLDGEELRGWIEWYDKDVIKLNRENAPNLVVPKHAIKYLYKEEEERQHRRRRTRDERQAKATTLPEGG